VGGRTSNESKARYNDRAYDRINIAVPKGRKDIIKAIADKYGVSVNSYIGKLIDEALEREQAPGVGFHNAAGLSDSDGAE